MIKLTARGCYGYTVCITRKWLDEQVEPLCPHGTTDARRLTRRARGV